MKKILLLLTLISFSAISQNNPALFRNGVETKFVALDTLTTAQRDAITLKASKGYIIFNADTNLLNLYDGTSWGEIGATPDLSAYQLKPSEGAFVDGDKDNLDNLVTADSNNVKITGDQTISGVKTFTSPPLLEQGALYKPFTGAFVFNPTGGSFFYGGASKYTFSQNNDDLGALAERYATFDFSNLTGATSEEKIYTFPDGSGTIALTSDIPTAINAANVIVSPSIGGETDAYAVMLANRTSIDSIQANIGSGINTEFQPETYAATFNYTFDPENPNKYVNLTGNIEIELFGTVNGDAGNLYLNRGDGTEIISFANGTPPTDIRYRTGSSDVVELFFVHSDVGIQWYLNNPHDGSNYSVATTTVLDFQNKDFIKFVLDGDKTFTATTPDYEIKDLTLHLTNDAVGSHAVTFPSTFLFSGGTAPTLTSTADRTDILKMDYRDGNFFVTSVSLDYNLPEPEPTYTVVWRVNVGSTTPVTATDGLGNWVSGLATGAQTSGNLSVNAGANASITTTWTKHASIPAALPDADFQSLFDSVRFDGLSGADMTYTFSALTAGTYKVRIYLGETNSAAVAGTRVFDAYINGVLVQDDLDMVALFGDNEVAGMLEYDVTVAGTSIAVMFDHVTGDTQISALEILIQD